MKTIPYNVCCVTMENITPLAPNEVFVARESTLDSEVSLHRHSFFELMYIVEGRGKHIVNDDVYELGPGCIVLIAPYQVHEFKTDDGEGFTYERCAFDLSLLLKYVDDEGTRQGIFGCYGTVLPSFKCTEEEEGVFKILFASLEVEKEAGFFGSALSANLVLQMLIYYLRSQKKRGGVQKAMPATIWDAYSLMYKQSCSDITAESVAAELGWDSARLNRELYSSLDMSFKDALAEIRARNAASLLLAFPDAKVQDVAKNAGFSVRATFFRVFEKHYGMTPSAYRSKYLLRSAPKGVTSIPNALFANVLIYIYKNYNEDLNITRVAKRYQINDQQLSEEFSRFIGMTFSEFLARVRIKKAIGFLKCTSQPSEEIASEVGFSNGRAFSRAFQKIVGKTPSAYRSLHR